MSDLSFTEKSKLEKLFEMRSGYVLDFSNRTFAEMVFDSTGKDIYDTKYDYESGSKANRLRAFWNKEPNHVVGKLLIDLLDYCHESLVDSSNTNLYKSCYSIAQRLMKGAPVQEIEALSPNLRERDFEALAKSVKDSIDKNKPETGLDRLHTFVLKYIRVLCDKHNLRVNRDEPLHSLFGKYVKFLKQQELVESEMTERILKSSISTMEAFNRVRNEQSFAHDNPVLNYNESLLIFNHIASAIRFIRELESRIGKFGHMKNDITEKK